MNYSQQFSSKSRKKLAIKCNQYFFLTILAMPVGAIVVSHSKCPTIATTMDTKGIRHSSIKDPKLLEPHYRPCIIQIMPRDRYNNNPQLTVVAELRHVNSINSNNLLVPVLTVTKVNWQSVYPHPASQVDYPWVSLKDLTRWQYPKLVSLNAIYISYR